MMNDLENGPRINMDASGATVDYVESATVHSIIRDGGFPRWSNVPEPSSLRGCH